MARILVLAGQALMTANGEVLRSSRCDIVIVGASIAGAALALALRDEGLHIVVIDPQVEFDEWRMTWGHDLEPNGLLMLEWLGLLDEVKELGALHTRWFAEQAGGGHLSEWGYESLPHTHRYAVCIRAHILRKLLRDHLKSVPGVEILIPGTFVSARDAGDSVQVTIDFDSERRELNAQLLVGADGPRSPVRNAAGIGARVRRYSHGWADTIMASRADEMAEGHIYFGRGTYIGVVPTRSHELVTFELTRFQTKPLYQAQYGAIDRFRAHYAREAPILKPWLESVSSWDATTIAPAFRMSADAWVGDRIALVGDAALTVNPITSQGVCLALEEAVTLATVVRQCLRLGDFSRASLYPYEIWRRPEAEVVQRLGDLSLWGFASRNPIFSSLKQRMLRRLESDTDFRTYVMASYCGLHWLTPHPLGWVDAMRSVGMLPRTGAMFAAINASRSSSCSG